jgi:hypothetical protein
MWIAALLLGFGFGGICEYFRRERELRRQHTKEGAPSTSTNSSMVAICAYHKSGWSCPFHAGGFCDSNGCNEAPRIQRQ